jgi:predicted  nucleic acid-binding Zn-ribbon protein
MGPLISSLLQLQKSEEKLRLSQTALRSAQKGVLQHQHRIKQYQAEHDAKQEEIKLIVSSSGRYELELKIEEDKISKLRTQLNAAKTNREYSTILSTINTDKADQTKLEEKVLELMTKVDEERKACKELIGLIEQSNLQLQEVSSESQERQGRIKTDIEAQTAEHDEASAAIDDKTKELFARLANRYDGEAMTEITTHYVGKRIDYACGGCFMNVPLESVNSLMLKDDLMCCPTCGRFLFFEKPEEEEKPPKKTRAKTKKTKATKATEASE